MPSDKEILRAEALRRRAAYIPAPDEAIKAAACFFENINPSPEKIIAGFWPKEGEFDTKPLLEIAHERNYICVLPVVQKGTRELAFARWEKGRALRKGAYGVMEPAGDEFLIPDIILIPLLAFDRDGHRLGYGGGYYDATLAVLRAKKPILTVGVGYDMQEIALNLPVENHDQKLDWIITPQGARPFS